MSADLLASLLASGAIVALGLAKLVQLYERRRFYRELAKGATVSFTGYRNPVRAALAYCLDHDFRVDRVSFERLADLRGDASPEQIAEGFVIRGYEDLNRLCDIGNFCLTMIPESGLITAMTPEEFQAYAKRFPA